MRSTRATRLAASSTKPIEAGSCRGWRRKHGADRSPAQSRRRFDGEGSALNATVRFRDHGSAHWDGSERDDSRATDARTSAAERATPTAVVRSGPPAAADCDAVSDRVRHVDELSEDAVLRAYGLRRARQLRGYVVVARVLGDDLHFAGVH